MRKYSLRFSVAAVVAALVLTIASCRKNKTAEDTSFADDHAAAEQVFDDAEGLSDQASNMTSGTANELRTTATTLGGCATITRNPGQIIIDFGSSNCTCKDGRARRGKILINYTGNYADSGSVRTITFDNFYQNDHKVTGSKTVTNMGMSSAGHIWFIIVVNGTVELQNGTVTVEWNRTRTWVSGYGTTDLSDDVYEITGSGRITTARGGSITISVTKPVVLAMNCRWPEAGSIVFTLANGQMRLLNYGDTPACDADATVTLANGSVRNVTLP